MTSFTWAIVGWVRWNDTPWNRVVNVTVFRSPNMFAEFGRVPVFCVTKWCNVVSVSCLEVVFCKTYVYVSEVLGTFWQIQSDICAFLSRMAFCEPGRVNRESSAEFWLNFRCSALDIRANSLEGGRWSFGLSAGAARAQAIVAAQNAGGLPLRPAFPNSLGTVLTVGGWFWVVCQKNRAGRVVVLRLWPHLS